MKLIYPFVLMLCSCWGNLSLKAEGSPGKVNVVYIGNSITEARNQETNPPKAAAEYLMNEGYLVEYANCGISGYTTGYFKPSGGTYNKVIEAADGFKDKDALLVFSIKLGTNDSSINLAVSPEEYKQNLKTIADSLHQRYPDCKIILNYLIWYSPDTQNASAAYLQEGMERLQSYFPQIKVLADENPGYIYEGDQEAFQFFKKNYLEYHAAQTSPTGKTYYLHPNRKGSVKLGEFWTKNLQKWLVEWGYMPEISEKSYIGR